MKKSKSNGQKKLKIQLTKPAVADLKQAETFIKKDNSQAAYRIIRRIFEAIDYLPEFPAIGRPGRVPNTRELVVSGTSFLIIYQLRQQTIFILRVLHAARKWPA